jgi:hypothetical protein
MRTVRLIDGRNALIVPGITRISSRRVIIAAQS